MVSLEKNNTSSGILISAGIIFLCYILTIFVFPIYLGAPGDIFVIPGTIIGCYIAFKYRRENQTYIRLGLYVGIGGAVLSTVFIGVLIAILYLNPIYFFAVIISYILFYILFGFITGYIMAMVYLRKEEKSKDTSTEIRGFDLLDEK